MRGEEMINKINYQDAPIQETPHGVDVRKLFDSDYVQVIEIKLMPGEGLTHLLHQLLDLLVGNRFKQPFLAPLCSS